MKRKNTQLDVLYLDEDLLVVNKPAGMLVIPDRAGQGGIMPILREQVHLSGDELRLVHRLDRPTSGVLLLARNLNAQRQLVRQFEHRKIDKRYLALVAGQPPADFGTIDQRIAPTGRGNKVRIDPGTGKRAITKWWVLQRFAGFCLLECRLITGRTHQIRVHLQAAGMPLAVDPLYGGREAIWLSEIKAGYKRSRRKQERPLMERPSLHASAIGFRHPRTDEPMRIEAALPRDFAATLKQLCKYASPGATTATDRPR